MGTLCVFLGLENVRCLLDIALALAWCLLDLENMGTLGVRSTLTTLGVCLASRTLGVFLASLCLSHDIGKIAAFFESEAKDAHC